jgi:hypothetical protein
MIPSIVRSKKKLIRAVLPLATDLAEAMPTIWPRKQAHTLEEPIGQALAGNASEVRAAHKE